MRYIRLVAVGDELDPTPGLVVKGTVMCEGMFADRTGILIAHDLLEHQNGVAAIGPVDDELEALGGIWQVRGRWGDMLDDRPSFYSPAHHAASDLTRMARELTGSWWPEQGQYHTKPHPCDDDFAEIIEIARQDIPKELDEEDLADFPMEAYLDNALHLMRRGYRKAERRFGDRSVGYDLFRAIKEAVKGCQPDWEGQEFLLGYGDGEATCREIREDEA